MPAVQGNVWRHRRAEMDLTSNEAAARLGISGGALRMIENELRTASLQLAYRAARLFGCDVTALLRDGDPDQPQPEPDPPPPAEPKVEPTAPPARRNGKHDRRGPRRNDMRAAS